MHGPLIVDPRCVNDYIFSPRILRNPCLYARNGVSDARINGLNYLLCLNLRIVAFGVSLLKKGFLSADRNANGEGSTVCVFLANRAKHIIIEFLRLNAKNQTL